MVLREPVHSLPSMARHWHALPPDFLGRYCAPDRGLRMGARHEQEIRAEPQHTPPSIRYKYTTYVHPHALTLMFAPC